MPRFSDFKQTFYKTLAITSAIGLPVAIVVSLFVGDVVSVFSAVNGGKYQA